jgi:hypothetical protein
MFIEIEKNKNKIIGFQLKTPCCYNGYSQAIGAKLRIVLKKTNFCILFSKIFWYVLRAVLGDKKVLVWRSFVILENMRYLCNPKLLPSKRFVWNSA